MSKAVVRMGIIGFLSLACTLFVAMPAQADFITITVGDVEWTKAAQVSFDYTGKKGNKLERSHDTDVFSWIGLEDKATLDSGGNVLSVTQGFDTQLLSAYSESRVYMILEASGNFKDDIISYFSGMESRIWDYEEGVENGQYQFGGEIHGDIDFSYNLDEFGDGDYYKFTLYTTIPGHDIPDGDVDGNPSPEPATLLIFGLGTAGAGIVGYRKRRGRK